MQKDLKQEILKRKLRFRRLMKCQERGISFETGLENYLSEASYDKIVKWERDIVALIPFKGHFTKKHTLIVYDNMVKLVPFSTRACAIKLMRQAHGIKEIKIYRDAMKTLLKEERKKIPYASVFFTLIPLEEVDNGIWVNVLKIDNILYPSKKRLQTTVLMTNQLSLQASTGNRPLNKTLHLAYRTSAVMRQEYDCSCADISQTALNQFIQVTLKPYNHNIFQQIKLSDYYQEDWNFTDLYIQKTASDKALKV